MPVERRLIPINAFVGLCRVSPPWPSMLAEAGFRLAALEVPVRTGLGTVTLDGVADAHETNDLLVVECKSGANIEVDQARKLGELDAVSVVQSASITLSQPTRPRVEVLYLCLAEHVDRIVFGLKQSGWQGPVLALSDTSLELVYGNVSIPALREALATPVPLTGPPPGFIPVDLDSPDEVYDPLVRSVLVACQAQRLQAITVRMLTEQAVRHFALIGKGMRRQLERKVSRSASRIAEQDPENYTFHPGSERREATVLILRTPEDADRRGRTQAYQAIARRGGGQPRRRARPEIPGQMQFESVLHGLDAGDDAEEEGGDDGE